MAETLYRVEDLYRLGLDDCELDEGVLVKVTTAGAPHGWIVLTLGALLVVHVRGRRLGVVMAETGFVLARDPDTVRGPDISFVSADRWYTHPEEGFWEGQPDLAVEVVSPGNRPLEIERKTRQYLAAGCRMIWVVHPRTKTIQVHRPDREPRTLNVDDALEGEDVVPGFSCPVSDVFAPPL